MRPLLSLALALSLLGSFAVGCGADDEIYAEESDIVGGVDATSTKLDAIGTIGEKGFDDAYDFFCTATLVAPKVVLTAKHCAASGPNSPPMLRSQKIYFAVGADTKKPKQLVEAVDVLLSPVNEGGFIEYGSDVAVYILAEPVKDVAPMPYLGAHLTEADVGKSFTAVGFGVYDRERNSGIRKAGAVTLQAVVGQPIHKLFPTPDDFYAHMARHEGQEWVDWQKERLAKFYDFTLLEGHEAYLGMGAHDAQPCSGDSGGPLVTKIDGKLTVAAVVSGSFKGATYPCSTVGESYATLGEKVQPLLASATGPCEGVPVEGRCEGTTAVRCVAETEGPQKITKTDCGMLDQTCGLVEGKAACVDPAP